MRHLCEKRHVVGIETRALSCNKEEARVEEASGRKCVQNEEGKEWAQMSIPDKMGIKRPARRK